MKVINKKQFNHSQLASQKTEEIYSLSAVVSEFLGSKQLFIHHDIIEPGKRSSGAHRHSLIEEVVYILKGQATVHEGDREEIIDEGALVLFSPETKDVHYVVNHSTQNLETLSFSISTQFDSVIVEQTGSEEQMPGSHFDKDLRDVPDDEKEWVVYLDGLLEKLTVENHPAEKLKLYEKIGGAARLLLRLDQAERVLKKALTLSYTHPSKNHLFLNLIRLAHVFQWKKEFAKSQVLFDQAKDLLDEVITSDLLRAFFHQHIGKLYFDQKYFGKAQAEFSAALSIRERVKAPLDQIESSRNSLKEAFKRWNRELTEGQVRKALPTDAEGIHRAHMKSIQEICSKDHSADEVRVWGHRPYREDHRIQSMKNDLVWVVEQQGSVEGYGHLRIYEKEGHKKAHVLGLYLTPEAIGKSFGKTMMDLMVEEMQAANVKLAELESTITSRNFYKKFGFMDAGPETTVKIDGVPIRCYPMKMEL